MRSIRQQLIAMVSAPATGALVAAQLASAKDGPLSIAGRENTDE
jgi:hypothetical protein